MKVYKVNNLGMANTDVIRGPEKASAAAAVAEFVSKNKFKIAGTIFAGVAAFFPEFREQIVDSARELWNWMGATIFPGHLPVWLSPDMQELAQESARRASGG